MPSSIALDYPTTNRRWLQLVGSTALRVSGWTIIGELPHLPKFVIVVAPHTSNWDFVVGLAAKWALALDVQWFGKDSLFRWPLGAILRRVGGRPVRRDTAEGVVREIVATIRAEPTFLLALAPEGTRKQVSQWRTGFYHIAEAADIPIVPVWFDWTRKEIGIGTPRLASGDLVADIAALQALYLPDMAKNRRGFWIAAPRDERGVLSENR